MDLFMRINDGEPVNVGTFHGDTAEAARKALGSLLTACAEEFRADTPVVDIPTLAVDIPERDDGEVH